LQTKVDLEIRLLLKNMQSQKELIDKLKSEVAEFKANSADEAEKFRIRFLGAKNILKDIYAEMKNIPAENRKDFGVLVNELKTLAENKFEEFKILKAETSGAVKPKPDLSLPVDDSIGSRHPISLVQNKIIEIFGEIGFDVSEAREIEDDWHNFSALNLPENHPARDMQDTFFVNQNPDWMLRTHTSSVQVRLMENTQPPIRSIMPGRVYRNETISARAHCYFHQVEGLYIAEKASFVDLKQTLYYFVKRFFGDHVKVRFRPSYFPFTEPSAEMDIDCQICGGSGCSVCKQSGWVEILGCGMVHPNVLTNCKIDAEKYSGFAFGMGIERLTMLKYQINDLRLFSENDIRFLKQFSGA
jgi:phenylalanyl-tRNA synthetase alpha chain